MQFLFQHYSQQQFWIGVDTLFVILFVFTIIAVILMQTMPWPYKEQGEQHTLIPVISCMETQDVHTVIFCFTDLSLIPGSCARWPAGCCCSPTSWCTRGFPLWCQRCPCPSRYQTQRWPSSRPALSPAPTPLRCHWGTEQQQWADLVT